LRDVTEIPLRHFRGRDGLRLVYRELGEGRPLILIHGYLSNGMAMVDSGIAGRLAGRGYRVILPDLRGHGDSARPHQATAYPPDVLADDGLALIEQLGAARYDLAGYSLGGRTVIRMLARGAIPVRAIAGGQGLEAITHTVGRGERYRHVLSNFGTFRPGSPDQAVEDWVTASGGDPVALVNVLDSFVDTPLEELARITVPTLVLTGAEDGHNRSAGALARALPNGQYVMLPGDHATAIITPQFERAVTDFLWPPAMLSLFDNIEFRQAEAVMRQDPEGGTGVAAAQHAGRKLTQPLGNVAFVILVLVASCSRCTEGDGPASRGSGRSPSRTLSA
jgi:pimeloyl-ACP methyl ester carboxylesterase